MNEKNYSKKWQLCISNPLEKGITHEVLRMKLNSFADYWCMCDEIAKLGKIYHTHIFIYMNCQIGFIELKELFDGFHIEPSRASIAENRDYIRKENRYVRSLVKEDNLNNTFEECYKIRWELITD